MLWTLLKIRFSAILNSFVTRGGKKSKSSGGIVLAVVLLVYLLAMLVFVTGMAMFGMVMVLSEENLWLYFGFAGFMALALCLITGIFSVQSHIFNARDNELLLSMPIPQKYILGSRMGVILIPDILFTFLINATALLVYVFFHRITIAGIFALLLSTLLIPMISFAVSALIGWLISIVTSRLPKKNLVSTLLFFIFFGGYMYLCFNMNTIISGFMINSNSYADSVAKIFPIYHMGRSISEGNLLSLLLWALCALLPFILVYIILERTFIGVVTTKRGEARRRYVAGREKQKGQLSSLVFKEFRHLFGSVAYLMNSAVGAVFFVLISIMLVYKAQMIRELNTLFGGYIPILLAAGFCLLVSMIPITASSVSLEGSNLWIVRSMPLRSDRILYAKLIMHEVFTAPFVLLASVISCVVLRTGVIDSLILILLPQAYSAVCAAAGLLINLRFPKLDYISETQVVKQSAAVMITMFGGMGVTMAFSVLGFIVSVFLSSQIFGIAATLLLVGIDALLIKMISVTGVKMFEKL